MTVDEQITRALNARADRTPYDATPLAAVEHGARGVRRRRLAAAGLGVAAVLTAVVVPLTVVRSASGHDDGVPVTSPSSSPAAVAPLGYLRDGVYHRSSGGTVDADVGGTPLAVSEVGDDVYVASGDDRTLTRIDADGDLHEEGCASSVPRTSPARTLVVRVETPCTGSSDGASIVVTGEAGEVTRPVAVTAPRLLGVSDDGTVLYVDGDDMDLEDPVHVLGPDGSESTVPGVTVLNFDDFDPVHQVVLASLPGTADIRTGAALSLDGDVLWSHDRTTVGDPSPDGRYVVTTRVPRLAMLYPPSPGRVSERPHVLDLLTGETVTKLPEVTSDGALLTGYRWDDDEHLLAEAFDGDQRRIVRVALDGTVTEPYPDLTDDHFDASAMPGTLFQTR